MADKLIALLNKIGEEPGLAVLLERFSAGNDSTPQFVGESNDLAVLLERFAAADWTVQRGPHGGKQLVNRKTGQVKYGVLPPAGHGVARQTGAGKALQAAGQAGQAVHAGAAVAGQILAKTGAGIAHAAGVVGKVEHAVKHQVEAWVDGLGRGEANSTAGKLAQIGATGLRKALKTGWQALMFSYNAGSHAAAAVAQSRGLSVATTGKLGFILGAVDIAGAKGVPGAIHAIAHAIDAHIGMSTLFGVGFVPWASSAYLTYSLARNPIKTLKGIAVGVARALGDIGHAVTHAEPASPGQRLADLLASVRDDPQREDYVLGCLSVAVDAAHDIDKAVTVAEQMLDTYGTETFAEYSAEDDLGDHRGLWD